MINLQWHYVVSNSLWVVIMRKQILIQYADKVVLHIEVSYVYRVKLTSIVNAVPMLCLLLVYYGNPLYIDYSRAWGQYLYHFWNSFTSLKLFWGIELPEIVVYRLAYFLCLFKRKTNSLFYIYKWNF